MTQADSRRSREAFFEFLNWLSTKGIMPSATVSGRKAAASQILGILSDDEAADVTILDVDELVQRFGNLRGKRYTPESLQTYKSRVKTALDDFGSYLNNPLAFRPSSKARVLSKVRSGPEIGNDSKISERPQHSGRLESGPIAAAGNVLPIPLRSDLTVFIQGIPFDLSEGEARKIGAVVAAMAQA